MKNPPNPVRRVFLRILFSVAVTIVLIGGFEVYGFWRLTSGADKPHPTDQTLIDGFAARRPALERLDRMSNEDARFSVIAPGFTSPDDDWGEHHDGVPKPLSSERWKTYRRLFDQIGSTTGLTRREGSVLLAMNARGMVTGGSSKGYAYSMKTPSNIVASIDDTPREGHSGSLYRKIKGHWYIYLEWGG